MINFKQFFSSTIGRKLIMSMTGLFLCLFLIVHLGGNLTLFAGDEGYTFNIYAHFMTHFPPVEIAAYTLYISILVHAFYALVLTVNNRKARPVKYAVASKAPVRWASLNMGLLGSIIFLFLVIHMSNFWGRYKFTEGSYREYRKDLMTGQITNSLYVPELPAFEYAVTREGNVEVVRVKDLYAIVTHSFSLLWYVLLYLVAMVAVAYHMYHGFQSAFRTVGVAHGRYTPMIQVIGIWFFAVIIPLAFASMPIVFYIKSLM
ncbi:succinate dehydrogenase / fumarate reductase cytochrome b subunit [Chitinophaga jiangningensis]|uniref:Succinate dehydrogenase / fumarate reductase cytochrome b subunit n=1 Tax=Chitinophaga jiangningensis TaxID=1419482 RepID=A0A1M7KB28_9BACT|nr:succinate dehydrogenase cytochrome b subunit [Chitinophaga jiangningensis]SHM62456.1 succinate dehydrogenase / fumarate reductase cytochrome b subunit [Chitinophaga jiangningensis]